MGVKVSTIYFYWYIIFDSLVMWFLKKIWHILLGTKLLKANFSKKPAKKNLYCRGGKIKFEFLVIKFKFDFPATAVKIFLAGS